MTPEQQAAMEALAGRQLSAEDIVQIDPLLTAGDLQGMAAALSVGRTRTEKVAIADIQAFLQSEGVWWDIKAAARDLTSPVNLPAMAVIDVAQARYDNVDTSLPIYAQMLGALVGEGIMTQAQMDAVTGMGSVPNPLAAIDVKRALGLPEVV